MSRRISFIGAWLLALALPMVNPAVTAQSNTGTILGTIEDQSGGVLPGVAITITNVETGAVRTLVTDERGRYRAPQLPLGTYEVDAALSEFRTESRGGITLTLGQEAVVNLRLGVGDLTNTITVNGETPSVQTQTSEVGGLVDQRQVRSLPLNGRDLTQLVFLQPGIIAQRFATQSPNTGQGPRISSGGARMNYNNFLVDGTRKNDFGSSTPGSVTGVQLGVDAIREFRVLTHNYAAEYGQTAGAIITAVTKAGTNFVHGSGFYFHRNDIFDARNYFDDPAAPQPDFARHQYGFSLGGRLIRDKAFFFGAYEGLHERRGITQTHFVPSRAARAGQLTNPRTLQPLTPDPRVLPYLALYPLPNGADLGDGSALYSFPFEAPKDEDFFTVRLDHQLSAAVSMFARYQFSDASTATASGAGVFQDVTSSQQHLVSIQSNQILSSRLVNTIGLGYNRSAPALDSVASVTIDPSLTAGPDRKLPRMVIAAGAGGSTGSAFGGITEIGPRNLDGGRWTTDSFQVRNDLNYSRGAHGLKLGGYFEALQFDIIQRDLNGIMRFNTLVDFLLATPSRFQVEDPAGARLWTQKIFGLYAQDDFRVAPRLTLNLGLRWEMATPHKDKNGHNSILLDPLDAKITVAEEMYQPGKKNFQPRVGFAWDFAGDGKSSLRGGAGVFHNLIVGRADSMGLTRNPPFGGTFEARNPPFEPALALQRVQSAGLPRPTGWPAHLNVPTMYHYNLSIEKELIGRTVVRAGYVGSQGRFLHTQRSGNTAIAQVGPNGEKFFPAAAPVRNPEMGPIIWRNTDGNSSYNALETSVSRRANAGLHFQVSYTLAEAIDDQSSTAGADNLQDPGYLLDPDSRSSDRGRSINDVRHNLVANFSYEVPVGANRAFNPGGVLGAVLGDWSINGIFTASSGVPFTPLVGFNQSRNRDDRTPDRPNLAPGASSNPVLGNPELWFDPTAFALPTAGTFGDLPRNTVEGPGLMVLDMGLTKRVPTGRGVIELRAEVFNLLNRANFGLPQTALFNSDGSRLASAGRITTTVTTGREMQFGVKYIF